MFVSTVPRVWQCEGVDEIEYLGLANSLLHGRGYMLDGLQHVLYPPMFPVFLSLIMRLCGPTAWRWMYMANAFMGATGLILMGSWVRRRFGVSGQRAAWFLLAAYYCWSFPARFLMSEPLYLPISFGAVILAWRILDRNGGTWWEYGLFGLCALLITMTRAAAISLAVGLFLAGMTRWILSRRRAGLYVALLALLLGGGFFAYWSVRADWVRPDAPESHWRWAKKYLGLSDEKQGIIATGEELTEYSANPLNRVVYCAVRYGQFVTSVARVPPNYLPLACGLFALFLAGLIRHWATRPWSPIAWYTVVFLIMILMTTWLSNYHRLMFVLAPFLFLFLFEGVDWWSRDDRWVVGGLAGLGLWGLYSTFRSGLGLDSIPEVQSYVRWGRGMLALLYVVFFIGGTSLLVLRKSPKDLLPKHLTVWIWIVLALHAGSLVMVRYKMALNNSALRQRHLEGVVDCGEWIRQHTPADVQCLSALPRMMTFLSDRRTSAPRYTTGGRLKIGEESFVVLSGPLRELPAYRERDELLLARTVASTQSDGFQERYGSGGAAVYEVINSACVVSKAP